MLVVNSYGSLSDQLHRIFPLVDLICFVFELQTRYSSWVDIPWNEWTFFPSSFALTITLHLIELYKENFATIFLKPYKHPPLARPTYHVNGKMTIEFTSKDPLTFLIFQKFGNYIIVGPFTPFVVRNQWYIFESESKVYRFDLSVRVYIGSI